jgi:hypothetical protein
VTSAQPTKKDESTAFLVVGLLFVVLTPVFIPAGAAAVGMGLALARRGRMRHAALVTIPALAVLTVTVLTKL